jgi:hypothetical protein
MLNIIDWLILPRETRELARLNKIYEALNENRATPRKTRNSIYSYRWKYHHEKIDLIIQCTIIMENRKK